MNDFENQVIDWQPMVEMKNGNEIFFGSEVVQLKTNTIPKGLVVLEIMFDNVDH